MKELAYYDGEIGTPDELKVPFNDRVHFFGDGVYEAALGAGGKIFLLQEHLDRLYSSAAMLRGRSNEKVTYPFFKHFAGFGDPVLLFRLFGCSQRSGGGRDYTVLFGSLCGVSAGN